MELNVAPMRQGRATGANLMRGQLPAGAYGGASSDIKLVREPGRARLLRGFLRKRVGGTQAAER